jgi:hypothetical protein
VSSSSSSSSSSSEYRSKPVSNDKLLDELDGREEDSDRSNWEFVVDEGADEDNEEATYSSVSAEDFVWLEWNEGGEPTRNDEDGEERRRGEGEKYGWPSGNWGCNTSAISNWDGTTARKWVERVQEVNESPLFLHLSHRTLQTTTAPSYA